MTQSTDIIIFRPNGMFIRPVEKWTRDEEELNSNNFLSYLNNEIHLEDSPTLLNLFTFLSKLSSDKLEIVNMLFGQNILTLLSDMSVPNEIDDYGIVNLEIAHFTELFKPTNGTPWFTHDFEVYGLNNGKKYTINMIPNNYLANLPINILKMSKLSIVDWNNKEENSYEFKTRISVKEFINAIIREISFYGTNEDKKRLIEERSRPRRR